MYNISRKTTPVSPNLPRKCPKSPQNTPKSSPALAFKLKINAFRWIFATSRVFLCADVFFDILSRTTITAQNFFRFARRTSCNIVVPPMTICSSSLRSNRSSGSAYAKVKVNTIQRQGQGQGQGQGQEHIQYTNSLRSSRGVSAHAQIATG